MSNFHTLEVVGRGSETQLKVCENSDKITFFQKTFITDINDPTLK